LFPIDWPEPFGLVMIEAMACGNPVLAFRCGSVPEILEDSITGKVVESEEEAEASLPEVLNCDRRVVRQRFEERFDAARMAREYTDLYRKQSMMLVSSKQSKQSHFLSAQPKFNGDGQVGSRQPSYVGLSQNGGSLREILNLTPRHG
jgi:hypothetical protein